MKCIRSKRPIDAYNGKYTVTTDVRNDLGIELRGWLQNCSTPINFFLAESCLEKYFVVNKSDTSGVDPSPNSPSTSQKSDAVAENNDAEKSQNDNTSAPSYAIVFKTRNNNQVGCKQRVSLSLPSREMSKLSKQNRIFGFSRIIHWTYYIKVRNILPWKYVYNCPYTVVQ